MKKWLVFIGLSLLIFVSACTSSPELPITPSADKLTFLFFYTDN